MKIEFSSNSLEIKPEVVQTGLQAYGFSITRDNKKLCYTKNNDYSNLWNFTFDERTKLFQPKKITEGTDYYQEPEISSDGKYIAFIYKDNIFKISVNGDSIKQLTFLNTSCYSPSWSPNGKEIAFVSGSNLVKVSSEGGTPTIFKNTIVGGNAFWISDVEIFYHKPGKRNFYIFNPVTQENKLLVSNDSVGWILHPRLSDDNESMAVYWNRRPSAGIWIISLKDSSQKLLLNGENYPLKWSKDSNWIYSINISKTPPEILMVNANTGLTKFISTLPSNKVELNNEVDITPDGKTIVCAIEETNSDVWMIENFDPDVE